MGLFCSFYSHEMGLADPAPPTAFWWTILVAYLAPSYKEETEAAKRWASKMRMQ